MSKFDNIATDKLAGSMKEYFGDPALYQPTTGDPIQCTIILDTASELQAGGYEVGPMGPAITIEAMVEDVGQPLRDETFSIGDIVDDVFVPNGVVYIVADPDQNDGIFVRVIVRES